MVKKSIVVESCIYFTLVSFNSNAALYSRLGGLVYYDDVLDVTLLADANLALTNQFGLSLRANEFDTNPNTVGSTGRMTLANANAWIDGMNSSNYLGFDDWRLPVVDINNDGGVVDCYGGVHPYCSDNEMGYLYGKKV
jgi:hypothetical protein